MGQVSGFKRIQIGVSELDRSMRAYSLMLGIGPMSEGGANKKARASFQLGNTQIELVQLPQGESTGGLNGLVFSRASEKFDDVEILPRKSEDLQRCRSEVADPSMYDFNIYLACGADKVSPSSTKDDVVSNVDHVVLRTNDAERCIRTFGEQGLGLRLALDQNMPEWGGRMLFFRQGKLTLEVIEPLDDKPNIDSLWGIAYQVPNIGKLVSRLRGHDIGVSDVRMGRKPGTKVATLKSHDLAVPTLFVEPAPS